MRRAFVAIAVLAVLVAACSSSPSTNTSSTTRASSSPPSAAGTSQSRPNVLFVLTDDMRLDDLQYLPRVRTVIGAQGVTFDEYLDNVTLCCPARTTILRGQY